ncbi:MAG TPA: hypothetical protein PKD78_02180, partial [Saprospiraceae bacterium]|nr:hypothetical protein [Saprospiraceae bacterium]
RLAELKYRQNNFGESKLLYQRLLMDKPSGVSSDALAAAERGVKDADWAESVADNTDLETPVTPIRELNTIHSEYSPYPVGDNLYFSSYRFPYTKDSHNPERTVIQVIEASPGPDSMVLRKADEINLPVNRDQQHTAHVTLSTDQQTMYFSVCKFVNSTEMQCALYMRKREGNGWGKAVRLPESVNQPGTTSTEPSIGRAPDTSGDVLYFVSDRSGGKGKRDIWYTNVMRDSFSHPINAGTVNTAGDDVTPFYHSNSGVLYFSSNGLRSLGGLDIYKATGQRNSWAAPEHMGVPINSGANDAFFALTDDSHLAYLSSNRAGSMNISEEACCYDIYRATLKKPKLIVEVYHKISRQPLFYTTVRLIEIAPDGSTEEIKVDMGKEYKRSFEVMPGRKYMLIGDRERYSSDTLVFETPKTIWKEDLVKKLYLAPARVSLIVTVLDKESLEPIKGATMRYRDFGPAKPDGTVPSVRDTVNPQHHVYYYDLDFDHRYRVSSQKAGYTSDSTDIISTIGMTTPQVIQKTVYLMRGVEFKGWALNKLTRDTLHGVTFRLYELPPVEGKERISTNTKGVCCYETVVGFEKRFMFVGTKPGFSSDTARFTTSELPKVAFQKVTRELLMLPLNLEDYLPIRLYFDNDEPDSNTMAKTTRLQYQASYVQYYRRKKTFIETFTKPLSGLERQQATDSLDVFFERDVKQNGWNRLFAFSEALYKMMERGDSIVLTLRGFASRRAPSAYNLSLTSRRVSSVHNHFNEFDGGIYNRFVKNGQLRIELAPMGEINDLSVSDAMNDPRRSVYSVGASRQRRLEVIGVEVNKVKKEIRQVPR